MKKHFSLFLLAMMFASNSYASKARLAALQFAPYWKDSQNVFNFPQYASDLGQYLTLELGPVGTFSTGTHAEGGFAKKCETSGGIMGLYLGHQDPTLNTLYAATAVGDQANPLSLYYAKDNMGYGANISYSDVKSTGAKELSIGGSFGTKVSDTDLGANVTLYSKSELAATKSEVFPVLTLNAAHPLMGWDSYGTAQFARTSVGGSSDSSYAFLVGAQDHRTKITQHGTFFYGTQLSYAKAGATKTLNLPLYAGLEADVVNWAALRGSISQSLINRTDTGTADLNTNNTTVALGATLKYSGFSMDGLLAAGTTGALNGTTFLTTTSLNYAF